MTTTADRLVDDYLDRLSSELRDLPRARRHELLQEISEHIDEARADLPSQGEAEIRTLLDRLGDPADIAVEARGRYGVQPRRRGVLEIAALVLLLVGGVVLPVIGWLAGVVLLWISEAWTTRDKLIGTLVVPGGLGLPLFLLALGASGASGVSCPQILDPATGAAISTTGCGDVTSDATHIVRLILLVVLLLAPIVTTIYLGRRMRRPPAAEALI